MESVPWGVKANGRASGQNGDDMISKKLLLFICLIAFFVPAVQAQQQMKFEVTPFFGTRFGGVFDGVTPTGDDLDIKSSLEYGAMFDYSIWDNFQAEVEWSRQPTVLRDPSTFVQNSATNDMFLISGVFQFRSREAKLRPFAEAGLGLVHWDNYGGGALPFENRLAYNLGVGAKYFVTRNIGFRLEGRWTPSRGLPEVGTYCSPYYGCYNSTVYDKAQQGQANLGVIIRF
jgi:opacity protein-like surface antigen